VLGAWLAPRPQPVAVFCHQPASLPVSYWHTRPFRQGPRVQL